MTIDLDEEVTWVRAFGRRACPYCGNAGPVNCGNYMTDSDGADLWAVVCGKCGASGPPTHGSAEQALNRWDERHVRAAAQ